MSSFAPTTSSTAAEQDWRRRLEIGSRRRMLMMAIARTQDAEKSKLFQLLSRAEAEGKLHHNDDDDDDDDDDDNNNNKMPTAQRGKIFNSNRKMSDTDKNRSYILDRHVNLNQVEPRMSPPTIGKDGNCLEEEGSNECPVILEGEIGQWKGFSANASRISSVGRRSDDCAALCHSKSLPSMILTDEATECSGGDLSSRDSSRQDDVSRRSRFLVSALNGRQGCPSDEGNSPIRAELFETNSLVDPHDLCQNNQGSHPLHRMLNRPQAMTPLGLDSFEEVVVSSSSESDTLHTKDLWTPSLDTIARRENVSTALTSNALRKARLQRSNTRLAMKTRLSSSSGQGSRRIFLETRLHARTDHTTLIMGSPIRRLPKRQPLFEDETPEEGTRTPPAAGGGYRLVSRHDRKSNGTNPLSPQRIQVTKFFENLLVEGRSDDESPSDEEESSIEDCDDIDDGNTHPSMEDSMSIPPPPTQVGVQERFQVLKGSNSKSVAQEEPLAGNTAAKVVSPKDNQSVVSSEVATPAKAAFTGYSKKAGLPSTLIALSVSSPDAPSSPVTLDASRRTTDFSSAGSTISCIGIPSQQAGTEQKRFQFYFPEDGNSISYLVSCTETDDDVAQSDQDENLTISVNSENGKGANSDKGKESIESKPSKRSVDSKMKASTKFFGTLAPAVGVNQKIQGATIGPGNRPAFFNDALHGYQSLRSISPRKPSYDGTAENREDNPNASTTERVSKKHKRRLRNGVAITSSGSDSIVASFEELISDLAGIIDEDNGEYVVAAKESILDIRENNEAAQNRERDVDVAIERIQTAVQRMKSVSLTASNEAATTGSDQHPRKQDTANQTPLHSNNAKQFHFEENDDATEEEGQALNKIKAVLDHCQDKKFTVEMKLTPSHDTCKDDSTNEKHSRSLDRVSSGHPSFEGTYLVGLHNTNNSQTPPPSAAYDQKAPTKNDIYESRDDSSESSESDEDTFDDSTLSSATSHPLPREVIYEVNSIVAASTYSVGSNSVVSSNVDNVVKTDLGNVQQANDALRSGSKARRHNRSSLVKADKFRSNGLCPDGLTEILRNPTLLCRCTGPVTPSLGSFDDDFVPRERFIVEENGTLHFAA